MFFSSHIPDRAQLVEPDRSPSKISWSDFNTGARRWPFEKGPRKPKLNDTTSKVPLQRALPLCLYITQSGAFAWCIDHYHRPIFPNFVPWLQKFTCLCRKFGGSQEIHGLEQSAPGWHQNPIIFLASKRRNNQIGRGCRAAKPKNALESW